MSYYKYDLKKPILPQIENFKAQVKDLVAMNKEIGIQALYQNHSGSNYFGAPLWDLYSVLKGFDKKYIASAFDICHAAAESGKCWEIQQNLLKPYTAAVYVKDFTWNKQEYQKKALGEGNVKKKFFDNLKKSGYAGPYSLHVEYFSHKDKALTPKIVQAFKKDLKTLKALIS